MGKRIELTRIYRHAARIARKSPSPLSTPKNGSAPVSGDGGDAAPKTYPVKGRKGRPKKPAKACSSAGESAAHNGLVAGSIPAAPTKTAPPVVPMKFVEATDQENAILMLAHKREMKAAQMRRNRANRAQRKATAACTACAGAGGVDGGERGEVQEVCTACLIVRDK